MPGHYCSRALFIAKIKQFSKSELKDNCELQETNQRKKEKEEQSKWEIKKKFEAKADGKEGDAGKPKTK